MEVKTLRSKFATFERRMASAARIPELLTLDKDQNHVRSVIRQLEVNCKQV